MALLHKKSPLNWSEGLLFLLFLPSRSSKPDPSGMSGILKQFIEKMSIFFLADSRQSSVDSLSYVCHYEHKVFCLVGINWSLVVGDWLSSLIINVWLLMICYELLLNC
jgi:hypothetical protein